MHRLTKKVFNVALIVGGFFVVFFGFSKLSNHNGLQNPLVWNGPDSEGNVAHADVPPFSDGGVSPGDSGGGCCGSAGGSSDCGDCGCGSGGSGDSF